MRSRKYSAARPSENGAKFHHWAVLLYPVLLALLTDMRFAAASAVLSLLLFALYGLDKRAAQNGRRRVPEKTLHLLALLGGWPGAWLARPLFRHKTAKQPFAALFYLTVVLSIAATFWLAYEAGSIRWLYRFDRIFRVF